MIRVTLGGSVTGARWRIRNCRVSAFTPAHFETLYLLLDYRDGHHSRPGVAVSEHHCQHLSGSEPSVADTANTPVPSSPASRATAPRWKCFLRCFLRNAPPSNSAWRVARVAILWATIAIKTRAWTASATPTLGPQRNCRYCHVHFNSSVCGAVRFYFAAPTATTNRVCRNAIICPVVQLRSLTTAPPTRTRFGSAIAPSRWHCRGRA